MDEAKHVLVVKLPRPSEDAIARIRDRVGGRTPSRAFRAVETGELYVYVVDADDAGALRSGLQAACPDASVDRLALIMTLPGASALADAPYHYVVETDVLPEADADLNAWYDREHLPGLAAVPGTVRAWRYRNLDRGPRYHACYDLATRDTLGSAPWLAVRATAWSDRVRPAFRNTRRTMFRRLD